MDVSLRQWPLFVTGLLLGAAGTMSLGLHRPTQAELAAAAAAAAPVVAQASAAQAAPVDPAADRAARAEEQLRGAIEAFRMREALAYQDTPDAFAMAQPPKSKVRRVVKEAEPETVAATVAAPVAGPVAASLPIAIAPNPQSEPVARLRSATSVMGAAPEAGEARQPSD